MLPSFRTEVSPGFVNIQPLQRKGRPMSSKEGETVERPFSCPDPFDGTARKSSRFEDLKRGQQHAPRTAQLDPQRDASEPVKRSDRAKFNSWHLPPFPRKGMDAQNEPLQDDREAGVAAAFGLAERPVLDTSPDTSGEDEVLSSSLSNGWTVPLPIRCLEKDVNPLLQTAQGR